MINRFNKKFLLFLKYSICLLFVLTILYLNSWDKHLEMPDDIKGDNVTVEFNIANIERQVNILREMIGSETLVEINNKLEERERLKISKFEDKEDEEDWSDYDEKGCPVVPIVFSGMTGRLGNIMSTYANMISLQWRLGYKYFLPLYMERSPTAGFTKPYLASIFKNVSFPTATWTNVTPDRQNQLVVGTARDASSTDRMLFNNSRTGGQLVGCDGAYRQVTDVNIAEERLQCTMRAGCLGEKCNKCGSEKCGCYNIWVNIATGANYLYMRFVRHVLKDLVVHHFQFQDSVSDQARSVIDEVSTRVNYKPGHYIGVHVRRTDFSQFSKFWIQELVNKTFFMSAMDHFRSHRPNPVFLVVSDDIEWCRINLVADDIVHISGNSPEVDLAVMAGCNSSIIDYGTYGLWGGVLAGGEVVVPRQTFRDVRWAADYLGWTYL